MAAGDWKDLLSAIYRDDIDLVKYHVKSGVNINYQHPELLTTPLIESISSERLDIVEYLLKSGADPTLNAGFSSQSQLKMARKTKNRAIIELVKSYLPKKRNRFSWIYNMGVWHR